MEDEKKREMTKREGGREGGRGREKEKHTGGPYQRGGAAKGDEGGGI